MASVVFDGVTTKEWINNLGVRALHQLHFKIACFWQHLFKNPKMRDGIPLISAKVRNGLVLLSDLEERFEGNMVCLTMAFITQLFGSDLVLLVLYHS